MEKVFSKKGLAYVLIVILLALQLTQSITTWCGGGFNGGSLALCILMLGLLVLVGVGISKKNKLLTIVSGVSILSVQIYVLISHYSGLIQRWLDGITPLAAFIGNVFASIGTLLLIVSFVLIILRTFKVTKNLTSIITVLSIIATLAFLVQFIIPFTTGFIFVSPLDVYTKVSWFVCDIYAMFIALLIPCVWHQVEAKE